MADDSVTVVNNENPTINLEIASFKNNVDLDFVHSIDSTILVHNSNEEAHKNILDVIREQKADKVDVQSKLDLKANTSTTYTKSENDALLSDKLDNGDTTVTKQGNSFNSANQLVLLNSSGQLPAIDGGLLLNVSGLKLNALGAITSNVTLPANKKTTASVSGSVVISLPTVLLSGVENVVVFRFSTSSATQPTISTSGVLKWSKNNGGKAPSAYSTISGVQNILTFRTSDNGATWEAEYSTYGGVETAFVQPSLAADGTLGGASFAVYSSSVYSSYYAYKGADNGSSTVFETYPGYSFEYTWYNPIPLKVSYISFTNTSSASQAVTGYTLYGSNDNSYFTALISGTNSVVGANLGWNITIPESSYGFYKYYKLYISSGGSYTGWAQATLNGVYIAV